MFFSQKDVRVRGKSLLLVKVNADRLRGGELKTVLGHPIFNAVNAQIFSPFHSVQRLAAHAQSRPRTSSNPCPSRQLNDVVNIDTEQG